MFMFKCVTRVRFFVVLVYHFSLWRCLCIRVIAFVVYIMLLCVLFQVFVKEAVRGSKQAQTYFREKGLVKKRRKRTIPRYGIVPYLDMVLILEKSKICNHIAIWHWCYLSKKM